MSPRPILPRGPARPLLIIEHVNHYPFLFISYPPQTILLTPVDPLPASDRDWVKVQELTWSPDTMAEIRRKLVIVGDGACGKTCLLM